jgi:hypothetical protein
VVMSVYEERARLLSYLSGVIPSQMVKASDAEPGFEWVVMMLDPKAGQMSWHISDDDLWLFQHLTFVDDATLWDGHTTEEKYERLHGISRNWMWRP